MSAPDLAGPLLVAVAYVIVYCMMITRQLVVKTRLRPAYRGRGETFDRRFGGGTYFVVRLIVAVV